MNILYLSERIYRKEQQYNDETYNIPLVMIIHWSKRMRSVKIVRQISNIGEEVIVV